MTRIDYASSYFPQGDPTFKSLKRLKNELHANASSVDTDLGGGDHGYLGLILTETEYESVTPQSAFTTPEFSGELSIPRGTDTVDALNIREKHKRGMGLYREWREVERALLRHITTAVESKYIDFLKTMTFT